MKNQIQEAEGNLIKMMDDLGKMQEEGTVDGFRRQLLGCNML